MAVPDRVLEPGLNIHRRRNLKRVVQHRQPASPCRGATEHSASTPPPSTSHAFRICLRDIGNFIRMTLREHRLRRRDADQRSCPEEKIQAMTLIGTNDGKAGWRWKYLLR